MTNDDKHVDAEDKRMWFVGIALDVIALAVMGTLSIVIHDWAPLLAMVYITLSVVAVFGVISALYALAKKIFPDK